MKIKEAKIIKISKILIFILLFLPLIKISYTNIEESISVFKYHLNFRIGCLVKNYHIAHRSFPKFLLRTLPLHQGNAESGWRTIYYLLPLFTFLKLVGGLSLKNIYLFTVMTSIISLLLFYYWIGRHWNKKIAFISTVMLGYSAVFQELARSGSYISFSLMLSLIWIICIYNCLESKMPFSYLLLGLIMGLAMYGYGPLRGLIFVSIYLLFLQSAPWRKRCILLFIIGNSIFILPGIITSLNAHRGFNIWRYFDDEHILGRGMFLEELKRNIMYFLKRIFGERQIIPMYITNNYHAHFLHKGLTIPFLIGILKAAKCQKEGNYRFLLILSFFIYFIPLLVGSSLGYDQARRSILYVIPTYLFIGLGLVAIQDFLKTIPNKVIRILSLGGGAAIIFFIIASEFFYSRTYILNGDRDLGILKFARCIKERSIGKIYYLRARNYSDDDRNNIFPITEEEINKFRHEVNGTLYPVTSEYAILKLALFDKERNTRVIQIGGIDDVLNEPGVFYLAKSPLFPEREFKVACKKNNLRPEQLFSVSVENCLYSNYLKAFRDDSFRFYIINLNNEDKYLDNYSLL